MVCIWFCIVSARNERGAAGGIPLHRSPSVILPSLRKDAVPGLSRAVKKREFGGKHGYSGPETYQVSLGAVLLCMVQAAECGRGL